MSRDKILKVYYRDTAVGTLAETSDKRIAFEYDDSWIENGFSISPFSLPLRKEVFVPKEGNVEGLFGVFRDSLPDAWGRLLVDRILRKNGTDPASISALDRLAIVGRGGMGALSYLPEWNIESEYTIKTLDEVADACKGVQLEQDGDNLDMLYGLGGSSGGARPKALIRIDDADWIVKFPSSYDTDRIGLQEYEYSLAAKKCGIEMSDTRLFESKVCEGYFGSERFDRIKKEDGSITKIHMITVEALLETDHRFPNLDYRDLMKLCKILTHSDKKALEQMYRRMCFNVFSHNRDDHSKNFAYLYNEEKNRYELSPAYDLTYSTTYYGEHTTSVGGEAAKPWLEDVVKVGAEAGLSKKKCTEIAKKTIEITEPLIKKYTKNGGSE